MAAEQLLTHSLFANGERSKTSVLIYKYRHKATVAYKLRPPRLLVGYSLHKTPVLALPLAADCPVDSFAR